MGFSQSIERRHVDMIAAVPNPNSQPRFLLDATQDAGPGVWRSMVGVVGRMDGWKNVGEGGCARQPTATEGFSLRHK